jgi:hypothetical protein
MGVLSPLPILIACASGGATARDPNVITAPELGRSRAANTYDAIRRLRPEFFRARESGALLYFTARRPVVAVDNTLVGGVEMLRDLPLDQVVRIEYVSAWKATKRYGSGFGEGIVLVAKRTDAETELSASR